MEGAYLLTGVSDLWYSGTEVQNINRKRRNRAVIKLGSNRRKLYKIIVAHVAVLFVAGLGLMHFIPAHAVRINNMYQFTDTNYVVPTNNVAWVSPDGDDASGNGTESTPYKTFKFALSKLSNGGTVVAKSGIYREPHFSIDKTNITLQAAPHAEVWLKGSDVVSGSVWTKEGNLWKTKGRYTNFCHVCTVNSNPAEEGTAAFPEQVFINDKPLKQVASKAEVSAGRFYAEDQTPTTRTFNSNTGKYDYHPGVEDDITYYVGSDPTAGVTEISQRSRAFTAAGAGFNMKGINVAQYAPVQAWGFTDTSGVSQAFVVSKNAVIQDSIFAQSSAIGLHTGEADNLVVKNTKFLDNGANGAGANRTHKATYIGNTFSGSNAAGFKVKKCGAFCTISEIKVTHTKDFTFRNNIIDRSGSGVEESDPNNMIKASPIGFWCDEGCIDAKLVGNFFTNNGTAIFYEVSGPAIIASNIIEGSGTGIRISGSNDVKIYNNTISRTNRPIDLFEDSRESGCNAYAADNVTCTTWESWSKSQGLSWNLTGLEMYNNILSSRAYVPNDGSRFYSFPVRSDGDKNNGAAATKIYTNEMFKGFDYNVYYRSSLANEPTVFTWDLDGGNTIDIQFARIADIKNDTRVRSSIEGRGEHSFDELGSRENNPYFIKEAVHNADYKKSNYTLKAGSPAINSGKPLPSDVALAIDPSGTTVKDGVAVNRGALVNTLMDATGTTPVAPDKAALQAAITAAQNEPLYIRRDEAVARALVKAQEINSSQSATEQDVALATTTLNNAVSAAKKKESDAQAAAETAVAKAEYDKTQTAIDAAKVLVDKVQDQAKKKSFQDRLDAIVIPAPVDKTALRAAITAAQNEPLYIQNDQGVARALAKAREVNNSQSVSEQDVNDATVALNNAITAAQQKETNAQVAAETAVVAAEHNKTQTAVDAAKVLVDKVQDQAKKKALQDRLNAITIVTPPAPAPVTKRQIIQPEGGILTVSVSGSQCSNIAQIALGTISSKHQGSDLREQVAFTVDCAHSASASGYSVQVQLQLSRLYSDTSKLRVVKEYNGTVSDITNKVSFLASADGLRTVVAYQLTDGGFGDSDGIANGEIVDPVGVYLVSASPTPPSTQPGGTSARSSAQNANNKVSGRQLANTGDNVVFYAFGAVALLGGGIVGGYYLMKRRTR